MGMTRHGAIPKPGSMTRERDGVRVNGTSEEDFPLLARCMSCKRVLRAETAESERWKHVAAPRPPRMAQTPAEAL